MFKRFVSVAVTLTMITSLLSCTRTVRVANENLSLKPEKIKTVVYPDGSKLGFDKTGGRYTPASRTIEGFTRDMVHVSIPIDSVDYAYVSRGDLIGSVLVVIAVTVLIGGIIGGVVLATKESCPFIYSWDGERFIFDAEPYGGAICQGLTRTDYGRLEHLVEAGGQYKLLLTNEVPETQHTDEIVLVAVDHAPGTTVVPDYAGAFVQLQTLQTPERAQADARQDLRDFVNTRDGLYWQSPLPREQSVNNENLRHEIVFEFDKPLEAKQATLVFNAGTGLWGSRMIREMLELRGDRVDEWYAAIDAHHSEIEELSMFNTREELYLLKLYVEEDGQWTQQAIVQGGGPYITEDRIFHLDLTHVKGDRLRVRINPPRGYWSIDYVAVDYGEYSEPAVTAIALHSAVTRQGEDVSLALSHQDSLYYIQPEIGDEARLEFIAPPLVEGMQRTLYVKTTGYYDIHLSKDQPEQTALLRELLDTPGAITAFTWERYREWRAWVTSSSQ